MARLIDADSAVKAISRLAEDMSINDRAVALLLVLELNNEDRFPTVDAVEVVRCKDCIYYDPPHVEDGCERYEYSDMPEDAFDSLGTGLVHIGYGMNVGGRCCVDDMKGYSEDKRVFVSESNYCGRGIRKKVSE